MACAKIGSDYIVEIWIRLTWNFHGIQIVMEKSSVKLAPEDGVGPTCIENLGTIDINELFHLSNLLKA